MKTESLKLDPSAAWMSGVPPRGTAGSLPPNQHDTDGQARPLTRGPHQLCIAPLGAYKTKITAVNTNELENSRIVDKLSESFTLYTQRCHKMMS